MEEIRKMSDRMYIDSFPGVAQNHNITNYQWLSTLSGLKFLANITTYKIDTPHGV